MMFITTAGMRVRKENKKAKKKTRTGMVSQNHLDRIRLADDNLHFSPIISDERKHIYHPSNTVSRHCIWLHAKKRVHDRRGLESLDSLFNCALQVERLLLELGNVGMKPVACANEKIHEYGAVLDVHVEI
jgi:hypothetical protein